MSFLSGYLPAEQGVACLKSLRDHTDAAKAGGDPRCRDQIMADTLVERITGQTSAPDVSAEVQIMMPLDALLDANNHSPADLAGYGPLPADLARDILATSKGRLWWRRLYAAPEGGPLAGGDPFRRRFDGFLRKLIMLRDRRCRDPFCDAPIRHIDHIQRYSDNGLTIPERPWRLRTRQLLAGIAWLAGRSPLQRLRRPTPHDQDHHPTRPHLSESRAVVQSFQVMIWSVAERPERSTTVIKLFVVSTEVVLTHSDEPMVNRSQAIGLSTGSG
jgi:hypothetical protein